VSPPLLDTGEWREIAGLALLGAWAALSVLHARGASGVAWAAAAVPAVAAAAASWWFFAGPKHACGSQDLG
jgi:hypothetical protein